MVAEEASEISQHRCVNLFNCSRTCKDFVAKYLAARQLEPTLHCLIYDFFALQVIRAEDVDSRVNTFGFSMSAGLDLDSNKYPGW